MKGGENDSVTYCSGQFEYSELNGRLRPSQAEALCNADPVCGAFTYKVILIRKYTLIYVKVHVAFPASYCG